MKLFDNFYIEVTKCERVETKVIDGDKFHRKAPTFEASYWETGFASRKARVYADESSEAALRKLLKLLGDL